MSDKNRCQLCEPAPHANCEAYTSVWIEDPAVNGDAEVPVCLKHYETIEELIRDA